jgi:hypothetical protein
MTLATSIAQAKWATPTSRSCPSQTQPLHPLPSTKLAVVLQTSLYPRLAWTSQAILLAPPIPTELVKMSTDYWATFPRSWASWHSTLSFYSGLWDASSSISSEGGRGSDQVSQLRTISINVFGANMIRKKLLPLCHSVQPTTCRRWRRALQALGRVMFQRPQLPDTVPLPAYIQPANGL